MLLPFMLVFTVFTLLPVGFSMIVSLTEYNVISPPRWAGFNNFRRLFLEDHLFTIALRNTLVFAIATGPVAYMLAFFIAWLLNELPAKLRAFFTVVFYAPSMSGAAAITLFAIFFSNDPNGWLNALLLRNGIITERILFTEDRNFMMPIEIGIQLWMSMGVGFLAFVGGLQTIDRSQIEAGYIDGIKNRWQELWFIILPNMRTILMFGAVLAITGAFSASASAVTGFPSAGYHTHTLLNHMTDYGNIRMELGYASAISIVLLAMMLGANKLIQKFLRRIGT